MMKILHLNTFDLRGGAARAAYRIHTALRNAGMHSEMLVYKKDSLDESVKEFNIPFFSEKRWLVKKICLFQKSNLTFNTCNLFNSGIYKLINDSCADIVNFHWIGNELISIAEIGKIKKPIVWTLHDMWAFCGAEHYDNINCPGRYKYGYIKKNYQINKKILFDIDAWTWKRKKKYWKNINFHFASPSKWLAGCLSESYLFHDRKVFTIPNCLDVDIFKPTEKKIARKELDLPLEKKVILFGADGGIKNKLKGFHLLKQALNVFLSIYLDKNIEFVIFGGSRRETTERINGVTIREVGRITDDKQLANLYSAADVFVIPSMMDNLPNTVMEAMSCGTPCVGFAIGGVPDMINHKMNGFLSIPFDIKNLAEGIDWVIADEKRLSELGERARDKVERAYNYKVIARKYIELYMSAMETAAKK